MVNDRNERGAKLLTGSSAWRNYTVNTDLSIAGSDADIVKRGRLVFGHLDCSLGGVVVVFCRAGEIGPDYGMMIVPGDWRIRKRWYL